MQGGIIHFEDTFVVGEGFIMLHHAPILKTEEPLLHEDLHLVTCFFYCIRVPPLDEEGIVSPEHALLMGFWFIVHLLCYLLTVLAPQIGESCGENILGTCMIVNVEGQPPASIGVRVGQDVVSQVAELLGFVLLGLEIILIH